MDDRADFVDIASAIVTNTAGLQFLAQQFPRATTPEITLGLTVRDAPCIEA